MSAILTNLSELIKMLADTFRLPTLFPALFFIGLNEVFIIPHFRSFQIVSEIANRDLRDQALISGAMALALGYVINAIEVPIIRFYEGYSWRYSWLGRWLTGWQLGRRERLQVDHPSEVDYFFPNPENVLPTKLGNIIAAFEAYPGRRYKMDGVTFWPRLFPILVKHEFAPYIQEHRQTLDFLLNTSFMSGIFALECIWLRILILPNISYWLPMVFLALAFVFYQASISSACNWGEMFRTAFDLFRYHLAEALGIKPVNSFDREFVLWDRLTRFWVQPKADFDGFDYKNQAWPINSSGNKEDKK